MPPTLPCQGLTFAAAAALAATPLLCHQDDVTGDGTTSNVIMIGEMLKQAERRIDEGLHPRLVADGFDIAKVEALKVLDSMKSSAAVDRAVLLNVAQTSLRTKIHVGVADVLAPIVVDAVLSIKAAGGDIDLHMVRAQVPCVRRVGRVGCISCCFVSWRQPHSLTIPTYPDPCNQIS